MKETPLFSFEFEPERYEMQEGPAFVFAATRRQFLETCGAGLLVLAWTRPVAGQTARPAGTLEARLHVGEDGRIRIFSGKVEEGQGPRTEIAMAAAEELRVPLAQVDVLLADTSTTPDDGTTAGSRTTPANIPAVRQAAAALRELLLAGQGEKAGPLDYRPLTHNPGLVKAYSQPLPKDATLTPTRDWKVLGIGTIRTNSREIVTGAHRFPSDIVRPGMLYGSILRPPSFGARLKALDLEVARRQTGVVAAREGEFAGCAAPTSFAARKAVQALAATAQWEEKPQPSSDGLFQYLKEHADPGGRGRVQESGSVAGALDGAALRLKATYSTAYVQHAPMEPRAAVAEWQDGKLTVWTGTSNPPAVRTQLAQAFQIPPAQVRVIVPDMGGGFGGKHTGEAAIEAARLAREASRPVSLRWTRAEEFTWAYSRPAALIEIEAALDDKKALCAWDFANYNSGTAALDTPYRAPNSRTRYIPCDSPLRQGSYRALGSTANNFARESCMDELAALAGREPLEFRLAHLENERIREVLLAATKRFDWEKRSKQKHANRGVGLACGTEKNSVVAACVEVEVDPKTGAVRLLEICQAFECGAVLNPLNLKAQVEGCIVMGLGAALREELLFENGRLKNGRFAAYRVPRFRDVPKMDIILVDKKDAGSVGAGETPIIAVAPAMGNAIYAATGQRVRTLPLRLTPAGS